MVFQENQFYESGKVVFRRFVIMEFFWELGYYLFFSCWSFIVIAVKWIS